MLRCGCIFHPCVPLLFPFFFFPFLLVASSLLPFTFLLLFCFVASFLRRSLATGIEYGFELLCSFVDSFWLMCLFLLVDFSVPFPSCFPPDSSLTVGSCSCLGSLVLVDTSSFLLCCCLQYILVPKYELLYIVF